MFLEIIMSSGGIGSLVAGLLEGLGVPWPGAVIVTAAGARFSGWQNAVVVATMFAVAYTMGSVAQYAVGRFFRELLERVLPPRMKARLDAAMTRYGQAAVLWTRPLAVGNYISIPAGMIRMNPVRFTLYTFLGIWPWAFGMAAFGSLFSRYLSYAGAAMPYLIAAMVAWALFSAGRKLWQEFRTNSTASFED